MAEPRYPDMGLLEGYHVTLECGDTIRLPRPPDLQTYCSTCRAPVEVIDYFPAYTAPPPALRNPWVVLLAKTPGLTRLVDWIFGPWRAEGDD